MILEYSQKIPKQIPRALEETLGLKVRARVKRLKGGEVNYSFKAETNFDPVVVRVFRYEAWPSEARLRLVEKNLKKLGIKHSKTIYWERPGKYFLNGFMVGEWIEGIPGKEAIEKNIVTIDRMFSGVAKILKKFHAVKLNRFGRPPFTEEKPGEKDFPSSMLRFKKRKEFKKLVEDNLVSSSLIEEGEEYLRSLLKKIDFPIEPVFVHGDATPHNVIWTKQGPVLIDWEDAEASSWVFDLGWMTYWWGNKVWESFLKGYGSHQESESEKRLLEKIIHLHLTMSLFTYFAYDLRNKKKLKERVEKLKELIKVPI